MKTEIAKALQVRAISIWFEESKLETIIEHKQGISWKTKAFSDWGVELQEHYKELERARMMKMIAEVFIKRATLDPNLMWTKSGKRATWEQWLLASTMIFNLRHK